MVPELAEGGGLNQARGVVPAEERSQPAGNAVDLPWAWLGEQAGLSIYDSPEWIRASQDHFGMGQPWNVTFPTFVAPLMILPERHYRVPLRVLRPTGTTTAFPSNVVIPFNGETSKGVLGAFAILATVCETLSCASRLVAVMPGNERSNDEGGRKNGTGN